ncbi:MAG TPA: AI-2E family transporter [Candidatus Saccharimonadales bacterium]|nr:AI-2E family transporter [Candidatus Saccharimonadales bacterium]
MTLSRRERRLVLVLVVLGIVFLALQIAGTVWVAVGRIADVLLIFIAAWAVSYLLAPLVDRLDRRTALNRTGAVLIVYAGIAVILAGVLALALPAFAEQLSGFAARTPEYTARTGQAVVDFQEDLRARGIRVNLVDVYDALPGRLGEAAGTFAADALGLVSATATVLFNMLLVLIIAFVMLIDGDALWRRLVAPLSKPLQSEAELFRASADRAFGGFVRGSLLLGLIYGAGTFLILAGLGVPFSGVLAVFSGLVVVIPIFGPVLAMIPALAITALGATDRLLFVLILIVAFQQVALNVIGPRIMSRSIGIHPLFVFGALLLGSRLAGFWGVLLAMPLAGIIGTFVRYGLEVTQGRRRRTDAAGLMDEPAEQAT